MVLPILDASHVSTDRILLQSFDVELLRLIRQARSDLRISPLLGEKIGSGISITKELRADIVTPTYTEMTPAILAEYRQADIKVIPRTVNGASAAFNMIQMGVDGVITDQPELFDIVKRFCEP